LIHIVRDKVVTIFNFRLHFTVCFEARVLALLNNFLITGWKKINIKYDDTMATMHDYYNYRILLETPKNDFSVLIYMNNI
jgi:hypothetical protein